MGYRALVGHVRRHAALLGFKVVLVDAMTLEGDCLGYFSPSSKEIVVAWHRSPTERIAVLAHEYGHLLQWARGTKAWKDLDMGRGKTAQALVEGWIEGGRKKNKTKRLLAAASRVASAEREADCLGADLLRKYGLNGPADELVFAGLTIAKDIEQLAV